MVASKPGTGSASYSTVLEREPSVASSAVLPEAGAFSHIIARLDDIARNPRDYSFSEPVPSEGRAQLVPQIGRATNAAATNAHTLADNLISAIHETHGQNFSVNTLPKNLPPAEMERVLQALAMEKRAATMFDDDDDVAGAKRKIHFPEGGDEIKRDESGGRRRRRRQRHKHHHDLRNLMRWRRLENAAMRARREARLAEKEAREAPRLAAKSSREARALAQRERMAGNAGRDASDAEAVFNRARRAEVEALNAERAAARMARAAGTAANLGGVRRALSLVGRGGVYAFLGVRAAEGLLVIATAPRGQSADKTGSEVWNVVTRSPLSREATNEFNQGHYLAAAGTVASDVVSGTWDLARDLYHLGGAAVSEGRRLASSPETAAQLGQGNYKAAAGNVVSELWNNASNSDAAKDVAWLVDLYHKDPEQARAVSRQLLTNAGVAIPQSAADATAIAHAELTGDTAAVAQGGQTLLHRAEDIGMGDLRNDAGVRDAALKLGTDGLNAGLPPIPRARSFGAGANGTAAPPTPGRPVEASAFGTAATAVSDRPTAALAPRPEG